MPRRGHVEDLKALGMKFVGPTICYALMQAAGLVNDHLGLPAPRCLRRTGRRGVPASWPGAPSAALPHFVCSAERSAELDLLGTRAAATTDVNLALIDPLRRSDARRRATRRSLAETGALAAETLALWNDAHELLLERVDAGDTLLWLEDDSAWAARCSRAAPW